MCKCQYVGVGKNLVEVNMGPFYSKLGTVEVENAIGALCIASEFMISIFQLRSLIQTSPYFEQNCKSCEGD